MTQHLVIEGVSKSHKGSANAALNGVSLTVTAGSCTAVLGPSGSGKSTLLRAVAGLETLDTGRVLLDGQDLAAVRPERRGMAMVFQRPLLFPHLNVLDNVAFAATVSGIPRKQARRDAQDFVELVQMHGTGTRTVTELSGGQQQRVAIARALAARPAVLLLDEPFSALDPELRDTMHELLAHVREKLNPTILMVTHDRDEAAAVADHIALVSDGTLLQHGNVEAMYSRPASLQVSRLMGGTNEIPGTVREGVHYSVLGRHRLPEDHPWPEGPATLVIRQERIIVVEEHNAGVPAVVTRIRTRGPRRLISLDMNGAALYAEASGSQSVTVGGTVRIQLPTPALAVIGDAPELSAQPLRSLDWEVSA